MNSSYGYAPPRGNALALGGQAPSGGNALRRMYPHNAMQPMPMPQYGGLQQGMQPPMGYMPSRWPMGGGLQQGGAPNMGTTAPNPGMQAPYGMPQFGGGGRANGGAQRRTLWR